MLKEYDIERETLLPIPASASKYGSRQLVAFWCVLYGLILLRDFFSVQIPVQLITVLLILFAVSSKKETIVKYAVSLIPVAQAVQFSTIIGAMALIILFKNRKVQLTRVSIIFLLLMLMELLHSVIPPFSLSAYITFACTYVFMFVIFSDKERYKVLNADTVMAFIISVIIANVIVVALTLKSNSLNFASIIQNNWRLGNTFADDEIIGYRLSNNPNSIGFHMIIAISSSIAMYIGKFINTKNFIVLMCTSFFIGLLSISRTFIVALIGMLIMLCFCIQREYMKKLLKTLLWIALIVIVIYSIAPEAINNMISRFQDSASTVTMGSRTIITQQYLEAFANDPLKIIFGVGMQDLQAKTGVMMNPHNSIVDVYVAWGVVGVIITVILFIELIMDMKKYKRMYIYTLPILCMILYSMSGRIFKSAHVMMLFVVVASAINMNNECMKFMKGETHE